MRLLLLLFHSECSTRFLLFSFRPFCCCCRPMWWCQKFWNTIHVLRMSPINDARVLSLAGKSPSTRKMWAKIQINFFCCNCFLSYHPIMKPFSNARSLSLFLVVVVRIAVVSEPRHKHTKIENAFFRYWIRRKWSVTKQWITPKKPHTRSQKLTRKLEANVLISLRSFTIARVKSVSLSL